MWGAAPRRRSRLALLAAAALATFVAAAPASSATAPGGSTLPELWGVQGNVTFTAKTFARLRRAGINTVVVEPGRRSARLIRLARRAHLRVVVPLGHPKSSAEARALCDAYRAAHAGSACAVAAGSYSSAVRLAESGAADLVIVRVAGPAIVRALPAARSGRVLAVSSLGRRFRASSWRKAKPACTADRRF